jgi:glycosyltransferase involved in cell wall biosynthesis
VTPSYNQAAFLEETLRSVADQDYESIEHIVVDGGSTDGSVEIIEAFSDRLAWWVSETDNGQADALNKAFARANGEILGWLNSDDVLLPGAVSAVVAALEASPDAVLAFGHNVAVDAAGGRLAELEARELDVVEMVRRCRNWVVQPGSLFRREAWDAAGPFQVDSYYYFDFEFVLRVLFAGAATVRVDRPLALYRIHDRSKTGGGNARTKALDHLRLYEALFSRADVPDTVRAVEEEARARSSLAASEYLLEAGDRGAARRELVRGLRRRPTVLTRYTARLALELFLPAGLVERFPRLRVLPP